MFLDWNLAASELLIIYAVSLAQSSSPYLILDIKMKLPVLVEVFIKVENVKLQTAVVQLNSLSNTCSQSALYS